MGSPFGTAPRPLAYRVAREVGLGLRVGPLHGRPLASDRVVLSALRIERDRDQRAYQGVHVPWYRQRPGGGAL
jgi:hypothetical protein